MPSKEGEYNGHPTLTLYAEGTDERFGFTFGVRKAELILASMKDVEKFVKKHTTKGGR